MYSDSVQDYLYDESALSRFEVITKPLYKCNEERSYYATQYQDILSNIKTVLTQPQANFSNKSITFKWPYSI